MSAGCAALDALDEVAISHFNRLGTRLRRGFEMALVGHGIRGHVTEEGPIPNVHFVTRAVTDYRTAEASPHELNSLIRLMMLQRGVSYAKRGMFNTSVPMVENDTGLAIIVFDECLGDLGPAIEEGYSEWVM